MVKMNKPSESAFGVNVDDSFDEHEDHTVELVSMDEWSGVSKIDGKPYTQIVWHFVPYNDDGIAFTNLIDGGVFETWQFTSMSLGVSQKGPSTGRLWASALLGHELTDAECDKIADNFDAALVGKRAVASWQLTSDAATGNKRLKIALLRPLSRKAAAAAAQRPSTAPVAPEVPHGKSAAERRAELEAQLAALADTDDGQADPY